MPKIGILGNIFFMEWIDTHAHLSGSPLYEELDAILQRAARAEIARVVNICTDAATLERGLEAALRHPGLVNTAATTPHDVEKEGKSFFPIVSRYAKEGKLVAIGETGLDYHYMHSPKETQQEYLKKYLLLALECSLPVVIHCRDAFDDLFNILDKDYRVQGKTAPGVLHCFTGTPEEAVEVVKRGWYVSFSGIVTFKKSNLLREAAKRVPMEQLLIETDAPYLAPQSRRGQRNEPAFLPETAAVLAGVKEVPVYEMAKITTRNAKKLFGLGD